MGGMFEEKN